MTFVAQLVGFVCVLAGAFVAWQGGLVEGFALIGIGTLWLVLSEVMRIVDGVTK